MYLFMFELNILTFYLYLKLEDHVFHFLPPLYIILELFVFM